MFEPYTQQDAQECFHCILNICNSALSILNESEQVGFAVVCNAFLLLDAGMDQ